MICRLVFHHLGATFNQRFLDASVTSARHLNQTEYLTMPGPPGFRPGRDRALPLRSRLHFREPSQPAAPRPVGAVRRALLADDEGVGIGEIVGVGTPPLAGVVEVERIARHVLGHRDYVLAVGAEDRQLVRRHQPLAHQQAVLASLPLRVGGVDAALGHGARLALGPAHECCRSDRLRELFRASRVGAREAQDLDTISARWSRVLRCSLPYVESSAEMDWAKHQKWTPLPTAMV